MRILVLESHQLDEAARGDLRRLWDRAFGDRFSDEDAEHAFGGVHVLVFDGDRVIGHASAVPRRIMFGEGPWRTVAYVEAVAIDPDYQAHGVGTRVMETLQQVIRDRGQVAMLSTGRATGFYERLGWRRWQGVSFTRTEAGVVADGEHGGLMIFLPDPSAVPDLSLPVTCEDRPGDAW